MGKPTTVSQDVLGAVLGCQRTSINASALALKKAGVISYSRGRLRVIDRVGLERGACECHAAIRAMRKSAGLPRDHPPAECEEMAAPDARRDRRRLVEQAAAVGLRPSSLGGERARLPHALGSTPPE